MDNSTNLNWQRPNVFRIENTAVLDHFYSRHFISYWQRFKFRDDYFFINKNLRTSTNCTTSMAFSDVIFVVSYLVLYSLSRVFVFENPLSALVCKLCTYFLNLSYLVSMWSFVLIAVDRFAAVVFPIPMSNFDNFVVGHLPITVLSPQGA